MNLMVPFMTGSFSLRASSCSFSEIQMYCIVDVVLSTHFPFPSVVRFTVALTPPGEAFHEQFLESAM